MSFYKVLLGHDQPLVDLELVDPQPSSDGVQATRRTYSGNGSVHVEGLYIILRFDVVGFEAEYNDLLQQFGVDGGSREAEVTLYAPDEDFQYNRFNGIAIRPQNSQEVRRRDYAIGGIELLVRNLEFAL